MSATTATTATKAARLLADARLTIRRVDDHSIVATCTGDTGLWRLGWNGADGWWCSCPSYRRCSHLKALRAVTVARPTDPQRPTEKEQHR